MASVGAYDWSGGFQGYSANGQLTFSQEKQFVDPDSYLGKEHFLLILELRLDHLKSAHQQKHDEGTMSSWHQ